MEERVENIGSSEHHSVFAGAIFMSNNATKRESLERKLFGLSHSQAGFVRKLKAGMLLFLFEHEERKLYGVFEATSDGALNIMPNAFRSTGMSFPAQIHFKRIWRCKPLHESEFHEAIRENYYTPNKFHFGLSYNQVLKLVELFSSKKINILENPRKRQHNNWMTKYHKSRTFITAMMGKHRSFDKVERNMVSGVSFPPKPYVPEYIPNQSVYYEPPPLTSGDCVIAPVIEVEPSTFRFPTSQTNGFGRGSPIRHTNDHNYSNTLPGSTGGPNALGSSVLSLPHKFPDHPLPSVSLQAPYFRSHRYSLEQGSQDTNFPFNNYPSLDGPSGFGTHQSRSTHGYEPIIDNFPVYEPSSCNQALASSQDYTSIPLAEHLDNFSSQNHLSAPGLFVTKGEDSLSSMCTPHKDRGYPEAIKQGDGPRRCQYLHCRPASDFIPLDENLPKKVDFPCLLSSPKEEEDATDVYSSDSQEEGEFEGLRPFYAPDGMESHPNHAKPHLYLDGFRKTSVFSRLSKNPVRQWQLGSYRARHDLPLNQLVNLLSNRRNQWEKKVTIRHFQDDDGKFEVEMSVADSLTELESGGGAFSEGKSDLPFFNFKRKSEACKADSQTEAHCGIGHNKEKHKKRKLVRPSFDEEQPSCNKKGYSKNLSQIMIGVEVPDINISTDTAPSSGSSVRSNIKNKSTLHNGEASVDNVDSPNAKCDDVRLTSSACDAYKTDGRDLLMSECIAVKSDLSMLTCRNLLQYAEAEENSGAVRTENSTLIFPFGVHEVPKVNVDRSDGGKDDTNGLSFGSYVEHPQEASRNLNGGADALNSDAASQVTSIVFSNSKDGTISSNVHQTNDTMVDRNAFQSDLAMNLAMPHGGTKGTFHGVHANRPYKASASIDGGEEELQYDEVSDGNIVLQSRTKYGERTDVVPENWMTPGENRVRHFSNEDLGENTTMSGGGTNGLLFGICIKNPRDGDERGLKNDAATDENLVFQSDTQCRNGSKDAGQKNTMDFDEHWLSL